MIRALFFSRLNLKVTHTRIKICGITSQEDARAAVDSGADAIGLVFYPGSPRAVSPEQAARIAACVAPFVTVVGLFVDEPADGVRRILGEVSLDLLQFHGDEPAAFCEQFQRPWIKALRMRPGVNLAARCAEYAAARAELLDSWQEGVPGGTGKTFDWAMASHTRDVPVVLAGGLHASNVGDAIARVRPAAVDVSGGVEQSPGRKDAARI